MTKQLGFAYGQLTAVEATYQAQEDSRENPWGGLHLCGDPRNLEAIKVVAPSRRSPEGTPSTEAGSAVWLDDASPIPRRRWKRFVLHRKHSINI